MSEGSVVVDVLRGANRLYNGGIPSHQMGVQKPVMVPHHPINISEFAHLNSVVIDLVYMIPPNGPFLGMSKEEWQRAYNARADLSTVPTDSLLMEYPRLVELARRTGYFGMNVNAVIRIVKFAVVFQLLKAVPDFR